MAELMSALMHLREIGQDREEKPNLGESIYLLGSSKWKKKTNQKAGKAMGWTTASTNRWEKVEEPIKRKRLVRFKFFVKMEHD